MLFRSNMNRICRNGSSVYDYDPKKILNGDIVDIHCHRPFKEQERQLNEILQLAFGDQ